MVAKNLRQSTKSKEKAFSFEWELPGGTPRGTPRKDSPRGLPYKEVGDALRLAYECKSGISVSLNVFNQEPITSLPWAPGSTQKATILSRQSIFTGALKEIIIKNAVISLLIGIF